MSVYFVRDVFILIFIAAIFFTLTKKTSSCRDNCADEINKYLDEFSGIVEFEKDYDDICEKICSYKNS